MIRDPESIATMFWIGKKKKGSLLYTYQKYDLIDAEKV